MRIGALEGGGTKMVLAVCNENGEVFGSCIHSNRDTRNYNAEDDCIFQEQQVEALGIGFFGPVILNEQSPKYGCVGNTPKLAWKWYPVLDEFKKALQIPVGFDTDVNAAALGEATWGITKGLKNSIYITVGTGIGAGVIVDGKMLHGMQHPEGGHILVAPHPNDTYKGKCPYHGRCLEGMASGPAIEERWGKKAYELSDKKEVWELEAYYVAQGLVDMIMLLSPERIVLGGGVMHQTHVMDLIRKETLRMVNKYIDTEELSDIENYIVLPSLNDNQGILGCAKLGMDALTAAK